MKLLQFPTRILLVFWLALSLPICLCGTSGDASCCSRVGSNKPRACCKSKDASTSHQDSSPASTSCGCELPKVSKPDPGPALAMAVVDAIVMTFGFEPMVMTEPALAPSVVVSGPPAPKPATSLLRQHCALII